MERTGPTQTTRIICSMATRQILAGVAEAYCQRSGRIVEVCAMGGVEAAKQVRSGADVDVIVLADGAMRGLEREGYVRPGSVRPFASSEMAIAVRAGAPRPDIETGAAVRNALLAARSVGYSTGPSGDYLQSLWTEWGVAEQMMQTSVKAAPGVPVARLITEGSAELGIQQLSELIGQTGIDIVGPLPPDIQQVTIFSAGLAVKGADLSKAAQLIDYLVSAEVVPILKRFGMNAAGQDIPTSG